MNRISLTIGAFVIFLTSMATAQFEGVIDMKATVTVKGKPRDILYNMSVKKDMIAFDMQAVEKEIGGGKFIYRGDKKVLWILNDKEKNYLEMPLKDEEGTQNEAREKGSKNGRDEVHKTGKTEKILGYDCDEWVADSKDGTTSMWGTSKLGNIYGGLAKALGQMGHGKMKNSGMEWERGLQEMNMFPLKIVHSKEGKIVASQVVTKLEPKTLAASLFEAPEGYKKQSLDFDMMKMMKDMQKHMKEQAGQGKEDPKEDEEKQDDDDDDDNN